MSKVGGTTEAKPANEEVHSLAQQVKEHVETKLNRKFDTFEPVAFKTQLVNGVNYFIKVNVGDDEHLHVRAHKSFQGAVSFSSVQEKKAVADEIDYF